MVSALAHRVVAQPSSEAGRAVLFVHGVFGRGRNFAALARRLTERRRDVAAVLVDLRLHGDTAPLPGPHTLDAAAADLEALVVGQAPRRVVAVVGHSLGGKVALALARRSSSARRRTLVLDMTPGPRPEALGEVGALASPLGVLRTLRALEGPFSERQGFIGGLMSAGHAQDVARWLATNLVRVGSGYRLGLDLDALEELLGDHYRSDLWPTARAGDCHFLLAERSDAGGGSDRAALIADPHVDAEVLPGVGHWLHREAPEAVLDWLVRNLP